MMNKTISFILLKPDSIEKNIEKDILQCIYKYELEIIQMRCIKLDNWKIDTFWPQCHANYVFNKILKKYLVDKELKIFILRGENCINKTSKIKSIIRDLYGNGRFSNCIHSPSDFFECYFQLRMMTDEFNPFDYIEGIKFKIIPNRFTKLTNDYLEKCATMVWKNISEEKSIEIPNNCLQILLLNDSNDINYIILVLYEIFINLSLEEIYEIVLKADHSGQAVIFYSDDEEKISYYKKILEYFNLHIKIVRID